MRSAWGYGSGFSRTVSTTENMAVLAPIPSASAEMAAAVKPGLRRSIRNACFRSLMSVSMVPPPLRGIACTCGTRIDGPDGRMFRDQAKMDDTVGDSGHDIDDIGALADRARFPRRTLRLGNVERQLREKVG